MQKYHVRRHTYQENRNVKGHLKVVLQMSVKENMPMHHGIVLKKFAIVREYFFRQYTYDQ